MGGIHHYYIWLETDILGNCAAPDVWETHSAADTVGIIIVYLPEKYKCFPVGGPDGALGRM